MSSLRKPANWVVSPPLAPDAPAIDFDHLARMTLGERELEREVLTLFAQQAADLLARLEKLPREGASLAHTMKGSARGIGAFAVAKAADDLEHGLRHGLPVATEVAELQRSVGCALASIADRLEAL
ncbi:Hpt domain-containing protein [Bradyrhizobium sp. LHD-71]|uniref:Hpt domain-containing protein n=1 Tax=Bradyrhizobium sp. LHD-71 TaxID=3072141 RepID=UPI00280FDA5B|nr:Hpt domain-containing protein [Bradyrhizobium sp. LHD-71]MDQ8728521.1 Hpt domain-containing protein [Bradyrhizobium sp. LHD-71]